MTKTSVHKTCVEVLCVLTAVLTAFCARAQSSGGAELDSLCAVWRSMPDNDEKAEVLKTVAEKHRNLDTVEKYSLIGFRLAKKLQNHPVAARLADLAGWVKFEKGKHLEAGKYYKEAVTHHTLADDMHGKAHSLICMANVYFTFGDCDRGLETAMKSLTIFSEKNDTAMIGLVYRCIANSCLEFQLYQTAETYFLKAMELDLKSNNTRNLARDYFGIGICVYQDSRNRDFEKKLAAKSYLQQACFYSYESSDFMYLIKEYYHLAIQFAELAVFTGNWDYADSSIICTAKCKREIERTNYKDFLGNLRLVEAEHRILAGDYGRALEILEAFAAEPKLSNLHRKLLYKAFVMYYYCKKDYKNLLKYIKKEDFMKRRLYNSEYGVRLDIINSNTDNEIYLINYDKYLQNSYYMHREMEMQASVRKSIWTTVILGAVIVIILLIIIYLINRKHNILLLASKKEILTANSELSQKNHEIECQSVELEAQMLEIGRQKARLVKVNDSIMSDLETARRLQQSIVPQPDFMKKVFGKIFILWRPLDIVSGDFYWASKIGDLKFIAAADCTGHGIPGACLSMLGTAFLNGIVTKINPETVNAADIVNGLKNRIVNAFSSGAGSTEDFHDGMDIALCIINEKEKKLSYSGSYRPLWIFEDGVFSEVKADRMPVAIDEDHDAKFTAHEIQLKNGQTFYMFSDGIPDQFGEKEPGVRTKFKSKKLKELLTEICGESPEVQKKRIEDEIDRWKGNEPQTDDILIIGITVTV
jgi:serine phosphatase RsbU (regulator of sigma subunit)